MARTDNLNNFLTDVANSLRAKTETTGKISASEFDKVIADIETGSELILQEKSVAPTTDLQKIKPDTGFDGLSKVEVKAVTSAIDNNIQPSNIKKGVSILGIIGDLEEGVSPSGTLDITSNGIYNVSDFATANVQVGTQTVTKGIIINEFDSNGYATDVSIVGLTTIPNYYFSAYNTTYMNVLNKKVKKVSSATATTLGSNCFYACSSLKEVNMPKLKTINGSAFYNCGQLETITLPDTLTTISSYGFYNCKKLNIASLPNSLTTLGDYAFQGCTALTSMTLPSGLTQIGRNCFTGCSLLEQVYFEGNTELGYQSLSNNKAMTKIVYKNATSIPSCNSSAFVSSSVASGTCFIYVPDALLEEWKATSGWSTYANQIKGLSELE